MKKIIDLEKQSKKITKAYYAKFRNTWNGLNPITRKSKIKKLYNRKSKIFERGEKENVFTNL